MNFRSLMLPSERNVTSTRYEKSESYEELLEANRRCFQFKEARRIRRAVAERFPLPPSIAYRYEFGSFDTTGVFELTPDFRLNVRKSYLSGRQSKTIDINWGYEVSDYGSGRHRRRQSRLR